MRSDAKRGQSIGLAFIRLAALQLVLVHANASTPLFDAGITIPNSPTGGAISTAAADLDLDGVPELVTVATSNSVDPHFRVHSFDGAAGWVSSDVRSPGYVQARADRFGGDSFVIDMNGDGYPDILLPDSSNGPGSGRTSWFENPANGSLSDPWQERLIATWDGSGDEESPAHMSEIYAGDMDGDGDPDVVTRDIRNGVYLLENNAGVFSRHFLATNPREGLELFDPDLDGDLDLLLNGVWYEAPDPGDGPGQFADLSDTAGFVRHEITPDGVPESPWYPDSNSVGTQGAYASKVMAVDLNGDGLDDVVITNSEELNSIFADEKPKGITVYLADAPGGDDWTEVVVQSEGSHLHTLDAADIDLDGDIDLLSGVSTVGVGSEPAEVFVYLNDGDGTSWTKSLVDDVNLYSGVLIDYDADGDADIVGPDNWRDGPLRAFQSNASQLPVAGDFNADGLLDTADYQVWRDGFGETNASGGPDGNADGVVDAADYTVWRDALNGTTSSEAVPEPTSGGLLSLAVAMGYRRFRFFFGVSDAQTRRA